MHNIISQLHDLFCLSGLNGPTTGVSFWAVLIVFRLIQICGFKQPGRVSQLVALQVFEIASLLLSLVDEDFNAENVLACVGGCGIDVSVS